MWISASLHPIILSDFIGNSSHIL